MKTFVPMLMLCMIFVTNTYAQSGKDLPSPAANLVTLTTGSYVIPMDNALQANAASNFNLKSYGLIVHLLNNNVKVKWVIRAAKAKDGIDFTVNADRILPSAIASASRNFIAGPFVIQSADTTGVAALVMSYYTAQTLTGNDRPAVYRTTAAVNVDIRHDLTGFKPKAAILNDGGNDSIHIRYMQAAGITTANYTKAMGVDLFTECYTFASEPHADAVTNETARAIRTFVTYGGNFLAQCEAVLTYENHSTHGRFHSTNGITKINASIPTASTLYPNPDLPYSQYQGVADIAAGGSVRNWVLSSFSSNANNAHGHATGMNLLQTVTGASVSKMNASNKAGGLVFYMGNHEFSSVTNIASINGIRMYMNAFLTPASLNLNCNIGETMNYILSVNTENFTAVAEDQHAKLEWNINETSTPESFVIEKSLDGKTFTAIATIHASIGRSSYEYLDPLYVSNAVFFYRIKATDAAGRIAYSAIRAVRSSKNSSPIQLFPNPATNEMMVQLPASWMNKNIVFEILDQSGKMMYRQAGKVYSNLHRLPLSGITPGTYFIRTLCEDQSQMQKFLKQ